MSIFGNDNSNFQKSKVRSITAGCLQKRLNENTVLVVNDWAMKFLPQLYRESQQDWFGKIGSASPISVFISTRDTMSPKQKRCRKHYSRMGESMVFVWQFYRQCQK